MTPAERLRAMAEDVYRIRQQDAAACFAGAKALDAFPHDGFWSVEVREGKIVAVIKLVPPREDGTR